MADNVTITAGVGTTVAADEVTDGTLGVVKVQYVKIMDGTLDGTSKAAVGATGLASNLVGVAGTALATPELTGRVPTSEPDGSLVTSVSVTSAATLFTQDTTGYSSISVQIVSAGSGTITYEASNDGTTWFLASGLSTSANASTTSITSSTDTRVITFPVVARQFRARVSSYSSGTMTVSAYLRKASWASLPVSTGVSGTIASGAADSGNPVKTGGVYNAAGAASISEGNRVNTQMGTKGSTWVQLMGPDSTTQIGNSGNTADGAAVQTGLAIAGFGKVFNGTNWDRMYGSTTGLLVQPQAIATGGASFLNIAAGQATTIVKGTAGTLYSIVLNSAATATNTTIIYDHPTGVGTVIGRPAVTTATVPTTLNFGPTGLAFANGLTIITATANGGDMTVIYK